MITREEVRHIRCFKTWRETCHLSQERLAELAGVSKNHLSKIERGEEKLSDKIRERLEEVLTQFEHLAPMTAMYDYVRVRFPLLAPATDDLTKIRANVKAIVEHVVGVKFDAWVHCPIRRYHYAGLYAFGDIHVLYPQDEDAETMGVLLELKGRGRRQLENFLDEQGRTWRDFFLACYDYAPIFKRLDLALNDNVGILSVPDLIEKCEQDAYALKHMRTFRAIKSAVPIRGEVLDEKPPMACTLYLGSPRKSLIYFCIYEKDREQEAKAGIALLDAETKNRFEVRLADERADNAVQEIIARDNMEQVALDIIDQYVIFFADDTLEKTCPHWARFIGIGRQRVTLTTRPEPYTFERSLRWLEKQVMPTLKMAVGLDQFSGTGAIQKMFATAKLSERHERLFSQVTQNMDEIVAPAFLQGQSAVVPTDK